MDPKQIIEDLAVKAKVIVIIGKIDSQMAEGFEKQMFYFETVGSPDLELRFDTTGGSYFSAQQIASTMKRYKGKITGVATGDCHSCGFYLLQQCDWRVAYSCLNMCMHKIAKGSFKDIRFSDDVLSEVSFTDKKKQKKVKKAIKSLRKTNNEINTFFESRSNLSFEQIDKKMKKDKLYPARKFLKWGFLDEIIDPNVE